MKTQSYFMKILLVALCVCVLSAALAACGEAQNTDISENGSSATAEQSNSSESSAQSEGEVSEMPEAKDIIVAPMPEGITPSADYTVTARAGTDGEAIEIPCYTATVGMKTLSLEAEGSIQTDTMSFCTLASDFDKPIYITVKPTKSFSECVIRPISSRLSFTQDGGSVTFIIKKACKLSLEFDNGIYTNLFIYAEEPEEAPCYPDDKGVIYYGAGVHHAGEIKLFSNQTLYLAPGAFVYGYIVSSDTENVTVKGRGILCGSELSHKMNAGRQRLSSFDRCKNLTVEDVIFLDSPTWTTRLYSCSEVRINNLKQICYYFNSDGIDICDSTDVTIENVFLRNYDDNISVKAFEGGNCTDITVKNSIFWADCAHNMLVGPEARPEATENLFSDISFTGITVLEQNQEADFYKGVMALTCADNAVFDNITWDGITIERMTEGSVINFRYSDDYATYIGKSIGNINVKNINCEAVPASPDVIKGEQDKHISSVTIENYRVNDRFITHDDNNFGALYGYIDKLSIDGEEYAISDGKPVEKSYAPYIEVVAADSGFGGLVYEFSSDTFTPGKTYTVTAVAEFEDIDPSVGSDTNAGIGCVNCYVYKADGGLDSFSDFAMCRNGSSRWDTYEYRFSVPTDPGIVTVTAGFWEASGTVRCSSVLIVDDEGNKVFSEDFSNPYSENGWRESAGAKAINQIMAD